MKTALMMKADFEVSKYHLKKFLQSLDGNDLIAVYELIHGKITKTTSLLPHDLICFIEAAILSVLDYEPQEKKSKEPKGWMFDVQAPQNKRCKKVNRKAPSRKAIRRRPKRVACV